MCQNARQHGLSGAFSILAHEDRSAFQACLDQYRAELKPISADETFLVETMAQSRWTLARARRIEAHLLDQLAGQPVGTDDPDACIAAELAARSDTALATVQRYASGAERSYFRARRELVQARSRDIRNKATEAQSWLKAQLQTAPLAPSGSPNSLDPDSWPSSHPSFYPETDPGNPGAPFAAANSGPEDESDRYR